MVRVKGHTLRGEGSAYETVLGAAYRRVRASGVGGIGFAICSCGSRSPVLDSSGQRQAWHRDHKRKMLGR